MSRILGWFLAACERNQRAIQHNFRNEGLAKRFSTLVRIGQFCLSDGCLCERELTGMAARYNALIPQLHDTESEIAAGRITPGIVFLVEEELTELFSGNYRLCLRLRVLADDLRCAMNGNGSFGSSRCDSEAEENDCGGCE